MDMWSEYVQSDLEKHQVQLIQLTFKCFRLTSSDFEYAFTSFSVSDIQRPYASWALLACTVRVPIRCTKQPAGISEASQE